MVLLKYSDVAKMSDAERTKKLAELDLELSKASVTANKATAKTKEIKRARARILTFNNAHKGVVEHKK